MRDTVFKAGHCPAQRATRQRPPRARGWLVGACVVLAACAESAPSAARMHGAVAAAPALTVAAALPSASTAMSAAVPAPTPTSTDQPHAHDDAGTADATGAAGTRAPAASDESLPRMQVHKSATCGCCGVWVDHMRAHGFTVDVHDTNDLAAVKSRLGVPADAQSCHTAEVGGLVVEGHVPAEDIKRALAQGNTRALVLPGMPVGSPGMEVPGVDGMPYTVEAIAKDGTRTPFSTHDPGVPAP